MRTAFVTQADPDPLRIQFRNATGDVPVQKVNAFLPRLEVGDEVQVQVDGRQLVVVGRVGAEGSQEVPAVTTPGGTVANSNPGDSGTAGVSDSFSREDHRHQREAFGSVVPQTTPGQASSSGVADTVSRSDHTHGTPGAFAKSTDLASAGASSTSEETLLTVPIAGGTVTTGGLLRLVVAGEVDVAADADLTVRVELDGTTLAELGLGTLTAATRAFRLDVEIAATTSSGQACVAVCHLDGQPTTVDYGTGAVAWGSAADLTVTVQFDVADAGNQVDRRMYLVEQL